MLTAPQYATDKQLALLTRLATERAYPLFGPEGLTRAQASSLIDQLMQMPRASTGKAIAITEPGMYRDAAGKLFKVQLSKESEKLYAKALVPIRGKRLSEEDKIVGWEFVYSQGAIFSLRQEDRLTLDEAKAFGIKYGVCCVCGRTLVDASSVAAGIGPICAGRL